MKRVMNFVKQNMIGFVLGILLTGIGVVTATTVVPATGVAYSNSDSEATTVNEALDELFTLANQSSGPSSGDVLGLVLTVAYYSGGNRAFFKNQNDFAVIVNFTLSNANGTINNTAYAKGTYNITIPAGGALNYSDSCDGANFYMNSVKKA